MDNVITEEDEINDGNNIPSFWRRVYSVFYSLQQGYSPSPIGNYINIFVQYIQIITMLLVIRTSDTNWTPTSLHDVLKVPITAIVDPSDMLDNYDFIHLVLFIILVCVLYLNFVVLVISMHYPILDMFQKLRSVVSFIVNLSCTILFIPILNCLMSSLDCHHFDQFKCWKGIHVVIIVLTIVGLTAHCIVSYLHAITYYDASILAPGCFSCLPSLHMIYFLKVKLLLSLLKSLMDIGAISDNIPDIFKFLFYFAMCLWVRYSQEYDSYYYSYCIKKTVTALGTIATITSFSMVLVSAIYSVYPLAGSLIWCITLIYAIIHQVLTKSSEINDWLSGTDFWKRLFGLYYLLKIREYQREDITMLRGYILDYIRNCDKKEIVDALMNATSNNTIYNEESLEKHKSIIQKIIETEFDKEAQRMSLISEDRSEYELFILASSQYYIEICKKTNSPMIKLKALNATTGLSQYYQYKLIRIIEDLEYESERKSKAFLMLKLRQHEASLKETILQEAELINRFWTCVSTESPDIDQLEIFVRAILKKQNEAKDIWDMVESYNTPVPSLYQIYITYLEDLHGDYISAIRLKTIAQEIERTGEREESSAFDLNFFKETGVALIYVSGEMRDAGMIQQVNSSFSQMFGYIPHDIIGQSLDILLPPLIKAFHKSYMINATDITVDVIHKEINSFGRHKSGHIIPMKLNVKKLVSYGQDTQFVAAIERVYKRESKVYVLTDKAYKVVSISEKANYCLGFSKKVIRDRNIILSLLMPEIFNDTFDMHCNVKFKDVVFYLPEYTPDEIAYYRIISPYYEESNKRNTSGVISIASNETPIKASSIKVRFNLTYSEIKIGKDRKIGYSFCFSTPKKKLVPLNAIPDKTDNIPNAKYQFIYNENLGSYVRALDKDHESLRNLRTRTSKIPSFNGSAKHAPCESNLKDFVDSIGDKEQSFLSIIGAKIIELQAKLSISERVNFNDLVRTSFKRVNYGENIKTFRITDPSKSIHELPYILTGEIQDVVVEEGARSAGNILLKKQDEEFRVRELLKNREDTKNSIREHFRMAKSLKLFFVALLILNISFMLVGVIEHYYMERTGAALSKSLNQSTAAYERAFLYIESLHLLALTTYINEGLITFQGYIDAVSSFLNSNVQSILEKGLENLNNFVNQDMSELSPEHQKFIFDKTITMDHFPNETYNLINALGIAYSFYKKSISFPFSQRNVQNLVVGITINDSVPTTLAAMKEPNFYIIELFDHINRYRNLLIYFIMVPTFLLIIAAIVNIWTIIVIQNSKKNVILSLFSLSSPQIEELIMRSQNFAAVLKGHVDIREIQDSISDDEDHHQLKTTVLSGRLTGQRRMETKNYAIDSHNMIRRIMKYMMVYIIFEVFYVYCYFSNTSWSNRFNTFKTELNETGQATIFFLYTLALSEYSMMRLSASTLDYVRYELYPQIVDKLSVIEANHLMYGKNVGAEYDAEYHKITKGNLCEYLDVINQTGITKTDCTLFLTHKLLTQGLFPTLTYERTMIAIDLDTAYNITASHLTTNYTLFKQLMIAQGNSMDELQFSVIFPLVIQPFLQRLLNVFCNSINSFIDLETSVQFYALIAFLVLVFFFEMVCTIRVYTENESAKELAYIITLVPPQYVVNNRVLVDYMRKYTKEGTK